MAGGYPGAGPENKPGSAIRELPVAEAPRGAGAASGRALPAGSQAVRAGSAQLGVPSTPFFPAGQPWVGVQPPQLCAALVAAKWRGMGTGLVPVRGHVVGITARLRRWPLGNQVSIWPRSGSGFPIPALISGIARYYSYHNNGPVLGSHHACRGPVEGRVGGAGGCHGPQCSLLPRALS